MSFPNLVQTPKGVFHGSATGVPVNGVNEFDLGFDFEKWQKLSPENIEDWLTVRVWALGTSVIGASYVGLTGNKVQVNFQQTGVDPCFVEAELVYSTDR